MASYNFEIVEKVISEYKLTLSEEEEKQNKYGCKLQVGILQSYLY